ncbi:hypothetical protein WJX72_007987 [[Myrmecia] bisecta]|uniref:SUN domain-containing protein n=1 Tax=[Myrmecia] bisecta TaxID=41462 RepID=A0AAW1R7P0_9CHLO
MPPKGTSPSRRTRAHPDVVKEEQRAGPDSPRSHHGSEVNQSAPQPSVSQRITQAAEAGKEQLQDSLAGLWDHAREWAAQEGAGQKLGAVLGLLALVVLTSLLTSALMRPRAPSEELAAVSRQYQELRASLSQTQHGYKSAEERLRDALAKLDEMEAQYAGMHSRIARQESDVEVLDSTVKEIMKATIQKASAPGSPPAQPPAASNGNELQSILHESPFEQRVKAIVHEALEALEIDHVGLPDYALHSAGGKVVGHSPVSRSGLLNLSPLQVAYYRLRSMIPGLPSPLHPRANELILSPGRLPGQCLALNGSEGQVDVQLRTDMAPIAVTLEYAPKALAFDTSSAPRAFRVMGYRGREYVKERLSGKHPTAWLLAEGLQYDVDGPAVQMFAVHPPPQTVDRVRVQVDSNWGNADHTCLYRVRVHGQAAAPQASKGSQGADSNA